MNTLVDSALLKPSIPLLAAIFTAVLLISFNRTINRLTKPISFLLISSVLLSTIYSLILFFKHITGVSNFNPLSIIDTDYTLNLNLNSTSEIYLISIGSIALIIMIFSYLRLPRQKGYVRYLISLSFFSGLLFSFAMISPYF